MTTSLRRELGIESDDTIFEKVDGGPTTYTVDVTDRDGKQIYSGSFSPRFVEQEYFRAMPTATIHVTTGGITAKIGDQVVVNERIRTDLERFWDIYQDRILPKAVRVRPEDTRAIGSGQRTSRSSATSSWSST